MAGEMITHNMFACVVGNNCEINCVTSTWSGGLPFRTFDSKTTKYTTVLFFDAQAGACALVIYPDDRRKTWFFF